MASASSDISASIFAILPCGHWAGENLQIIEPNGSV
jgi:hypothetical protein